MEAEYQKLSKACPKCGEPLYMETTYTFTGHDTEVGGDGISPTFAPGYRVKCQKCGFLSPFYDSPLEIYDKWDTAPIV